MSNNMELKTLFAEGSVEEVKEFLSDERAFFNVNEVVADFGYTALQVASIRGRCDIVSLLLAHPRINVNQPGNHIRSPFYSACYCNRVEVVKVFLKDSRVDINMADDDDRTPVWHACCDGSVDVVKWMILSEREIDIRRKGKYFEWGKGARGEECLPIDAARKGKHEGVVSLVGKFMKDQAQTRRELLDELLRREWKALVLGEDVAGLRKFVSENPFLDVGINEATGEDGFTELHLACRKGDHELVSILLDHLGINVNQKDKKERTPFHFACLEGNVEVVKVLLKDDRVDINTRDTGERSPLLDASCKGFVEVVKWMIVSGREFKNFDKKRDDARNAAERAAFHNKPEVASLLKSFIRNPAQTRQRIRVELGAVDADSANLFAMTVFLCDDYLKIKNPRLNVDAVRFFKIARRLPMELQMVLSYRVYESMNEIILSKNSEPEFRSLARRYATRKSDADMKPIYCSQRVAALLIAFIVACVAVVWVNIY